MGYDKEFDMRYDRCTLTSEYLCVLVTCYIVDYVHGQLFELLLCCLTVLYTSLHCC